MWGAPFRSALLAASLFFSAVQSQERPQELTFNSDRCEGYAARNVQQNGASLTADLGLIGKGCGIYGNDLTQLKLQVTYETNERLHVKISDPSEQRYQVPEFTLPRPDADSGITPESSDIVFKFNERPFSFSVERRSSGEKLFDTTGNAFVFEEQYIRLATNLGKNPNIYGLGEHTEDFRLPTWNLTRTLWNRDSYGVPAHSNLYSSHPVYFEHRTTGTHGVLLLNSNGMDVKMNSTSSGDTKLEYNVIGGILDFYFIAGPTPNKVAEQYAQIVRLPALTAYWGLGSHQCRYGYRDWIEVAEVIANYSKAEIPLETMWTDIDYMYKRWIFTLDPDRYPIDKMRKIVDYLHSREQKYILMIDPALAYQPYPSFQRALIDNVLMVEENGDVHKGVVWPGVTAFPDWFHPNTTAYWTEEFRRFFDKEDGVDIDGSWIDMNEPASFCPYPCEDPEGEAQRQDMPPARLPPRAPPRPIPGFPETDSANEEDSKNQTIKTYGSEYQYFLARSLINTTGDSEVLDHFGPLDSSTTEVGVSRKRQSNRDIDLIDPPYQIQNQVSYGLSDRTAHTDIVHANGLVEYDVHNLYGSSMSSATYEAMLARRPNKRPFIITRSTFVGAGHYVGKWLGDNLSTWWHYRNSISGLLQFSTIYQVPMVGADVCGFGANTTSTLCARWTMLGAFYPFFRNHNGDTSISQEYYRWPIVATAARKAIGIRYCLLDYFYTALWRQSETGSPSLLPLWFEYPKDEKTFGIDLQYLYGPSIMVAPVTAENATSVSVYLPDDVWYDYFTHDVVSPGNKTLNDIDFDEIPLFIKGGSIIPMRQASNANTTAEVRRRNFELLIAPGKDGKASGELYLDDGDSLVQEKTTHIEFSYSAGKVTAKGTYDYAVDQKIVSIQVLGKNGKKEDVSFGLTKDFEWS